MEQMYLVEIFIDKVTIFVPEEEEEQSSANKKLIIKIRFGPKVEFIIKEGQLAVNDENKDDIVECDEQGRRKWSRTIRVGKSYLFPSYSDTVLMILSKFPLEIEVWNDDETEIEIFVGIGTMYWETQFFHMLKETAQASKLHEPLTIKQHTPLFAECCCKQVGEIAFILRLSALGDSIITEFQQLMKDPDAFVFRTNKAPSMFQCKRVEGDDPNFCMVGSLYETTTLEDPDVINNAQKKIEVCTELQSCGVGAQNGNYTCEHETEDQDKPKKKKYAITKIRMGDITGPCGNSTCPLAHKVKMYIRNLESYKAEASGAVSSTKDISEKKICGTCSCKDDRWHRDECPENQAGSDGKAGGGKVTCSGCGGLTQSGKTCEDGEKKMHGTGATPPISTTNFVFSVTKIPNFKDAIYGQDYTVQNFSTNYNIMSSCQCQPTTSQCASSARGCGCRSNVVTSNTPNIKTPEHKASSRSMGTNNHLVYNLKVDDANRKIAVYNCLDLPDDKDCKCNPPKPAPPCKTLDCDCITETANIAARKAHKPYCPSYKHRSDCPVTMSQEEEKKKVDDDEDETEPLPYGLPPIQLGPCPVLGRPCSVPDGFARMYKTAALPAQPPSWSDAGKVCCSKEYERIKKAIKEYMKNEKEDDFRCVNKFDVDTERRCCDKEQRILALMGKSCCGSHKMAIQEKFKDQKPS